LKQHLEQLFVQALHKLAINIDFTPRLERCKDQQHGDFACNIAMILAKSQKLKPIDLANKIVAAMPVSTYLLKVEIAGPGFINLFLAPQAYQQLLHSIFVQQDTYGQINLGQGKKVLLEFVSANPTGPLHVGHGRGAAYGAALANLLRTAGYQVQTEYYVNDAGRQMDILALSIWLRYLELCGEKFTFPANAYQGDYIWDIAATLHRQYQAKYYAAATLVFEAVNSDNADEFLDNLIASQRKLLGDKISREILQLGLDAILGDIAQDLAQFGVNYDNWCSEYQLMPQVPKLIAKLEQDNFTHVADGALWFKSEQFGDEKNRVIRRENGNFTYFASDIAYHADKLARGFDLLINIWGADHHGYIPRLRAAMQALGADADKLQVLLVQFATLYRGGEKLQMSTRSGEFVTLRELRQEVGNDAARFFYVQRKAEQHLDFDLDLAKSQSQDNPVYYIQYAHARICSLWREYSGQEWQLQKFDFNLLITTQELDLIKHLSRYPELIEQAAANFEPHQLTYYLRDLAQLFHTYYNAHKFLTADENLTQTRLGLCKAVQQVLQNGLTIIGVSAPEVM
jgi:arginyl-tRNA synthetase